MSKFYKKYVCYDPTLTRFSELGNVALNKTFWERSYATTRKFSNIYPGLSDTTFRPIKNDSFERIRKFPHSIPKVKTDYDSPGKSSKASIEKVPEKTGKPTAGEDKILQNKMAKRLKTLVLLPKPPLENICPYDECWPKTSIAATQSLPIVQRPMHQLIWKDMSAQRRVSRLPSLSKIVETDFPTPQISLHRDITSSRHAGETTVVVSYDAPKLEKSKSVTSVKLSRSNSKESLKALLLCNSSSSRCNVSKTFSTSLKPSIEAVAIETDSSCSMSPATLLAMDRLQFWRERRPKKTPPLSPDLCKLPESKKIQGSLVHRRALKHPLKPKENLHDSISLPSESLTCILDEYSSIPILKRVELYASYKNRKSFDSRKGISNTNRDSHSLT